MFSAVASFASSDLAGRRPGALARPERSSEWQEAGHFEPDERCTAEILSERSST
jgi:hypothetical protein